ncbi:hypothetical protein LINPERPRIM_LOCUS33811, partial [Linum perenne]
MRLEGSICHLGLINQNKFTFDLGNIMINLESFKCIGTRNSTGWNIRPLHIRLTVFHAFFLERMRNLHLHCSMMDLIVGREYIKAKSLLQELRDGGWEKLIQEVMSFCSKYEVEVPNFSTIIGRGDKQMTLEHMYHFDYFNQSIDFQLGALNSRFDESSVRLLQLSVALDPSNSFRSFNADDIYKLAEEFYPEDFQYNELIALEGEL